MSVLLAKGVDGIWQNWPIAFGCAMYLASIVFAAIYQALAVGDLESISGLEMDNTRSAPESWFFNRHIPYNIMLCAFIFGASSTGVSAIGKIVPC